MKKSAIILFTLWSGMLLHAKTITPEEARQKALSFLSAQPSSNVSHGFRQSARHCDIHLANSAAEGYYVFNVDAPASGYVIVGGDDRLPAIIGYATSGHFDESLMPPSMKSHLQNLVGDVVRHDAQSQAGSSVPLGMMEPVEPLLTTHWAQEAPYYNQCPVLIGYHCYTGCTATAMAQALCYHGRHTGLPQQLLCDIPSYTTASHGQFVDAIPASTTFDWANMLDEYDSSANEEQTNAVATLMLACGASVQTAYTVNASGSSADLFRIPHALRTFFGYDGIGVLRSDYTYQQWTKMIYDELAAGRPVIYTGEKVSGGGHAFLVDGFDGDTFFHINWGWGQLCDGYYLLSSTNPDGAEGVGGGTGSDGYSSQQMAIVGIQPATGQPTDNDQQLTFKVTDVSGNTVFCNVYNYNYTGEETVKFDFGMAFVGDNSQLEPITSTISKNKALAYAHYYPNSKFTIPKNAKPAGTYNVVAISRRSETSQWLTRMDTTYQYIQAVYDNDGNVALRQMPADGYLLKTDTLLAGKPCFSGRKVTVTAEVSNEGTEFYGKLYLFASRYASKGQPQSACGVTIQKGEHQTVALDFTPSLEGTYTLWLAIDDKGANVIATAQVDVTANPNASGGPFVITSLNLDGVDASDWYVTDDGLSMVDIVNPLICGSAIVSNITNVTYTNASAVLTLYYYNPSTETWVKQGKSSWNIPSFPGNYSFILSGINRQLTQIGAYKIVLSVSGTDYDTCYINYLFGYTAWDAQGNRKVMKSNGTDITIDDDLLAVDLQGLEFTSLEPNTKWNTLYFLAEGQEVPESLIGKNVICGDSAEAITLVNGLGGFFTPKEFYAGSVKYSCVFNGPVIDNNSWNTLVLPFKPEKARVVSSDAESFDLEWGSEGLLQLMTFIGDDGSRAFFAPTDELEAYTPYLMRVPVVQEQNIVDQPVVFSAAEVEFAPSHKAVRAGYTFKFIGQLTEPAGSTAAYGLTTTSEWPLFVSADNARRPFTAFFEAANPVDVLQDIVWSGINDVQTTPSAASQGIYNLSGVKQNRPFQQLPKGIYVIDGRKIVK